MWELDLNEGWVLKNWCFWTVVLEKPLESPLDSKEIKPVKRKSILNIHWKDWSWSSNTLATWCEEPTHWKRPWCWERLKAGGEGDDRGRDGWMASLPQWTWIWASSGRWWRTGKPGAMQSVWSQKQDTTERLSVSILILSHMCYHINLLNLSAIVDVKKYVFISIWVKINKYLEFKIKFLRYTYW